MNQQTKQPLPKTVRFTRPILLIAVMSIFNSCLQARNPILVGAADPDALVIEETAWIYPTFSTPEGDFYAFSSRDLVNWERHGPLLKFRDIDWIPEGRQAWAPGIIEKGGKFYLYYSVGPKPSHIGVAVSDSPAGPFRDSGRPLLSDEDDPGFEAIDAMVFTDPADGKVYFYAGGSAGAKLRVFELNDDMVSFKQEFEVETPPRFTEASYMHFHDGVYHFTYSHGYWRAASYSVHHATAPGPTGPWTYRGAILASDDRHKGPGHHSVIQDPVSEEWLIVYHRWNNREDNGPFHGDRDVAIDKLVHEKDGGIRPVEMTDDGVAGWATRK